MTTDDLNDFLKVKFLLPIVAIVLIIKYWPYNLKFPRWLWSANELNYSVNGTQMNFFIGYIAQKSIECK